jgi:hypothetical protein
MRLKDISLMTTALDAKYDDCIECYPAKALARIAVSVGLLLPKYADSHKLGFIYLW